MRLIALEQLRDQSLLIWRHCSAVYLQKDESRTTQNKVKDCQFPSQHKFSVSTPLTEPLLVRLFSLNRWKMTKLYNSATKFI